MSTQKGSAGLFWPHAPSKFRPQSAMLSKITA